VARHVHARAGCAQAMINEERSERLRKVNCWLEFQDKTSLSLPSSSADLRVSPF
jgi:hypothetical protein